MEFLLLVASSDGDYVGATDSGPVVTAALEQWGLLATLVGEMAATSAHPMSIFEDQLDSSILSVQTAAGQNIALLYEKSFTPCEDDEDEDDDVEDDEGEDGDFRRGQWVQRYEVYPDGEFSLESKLRTLSTASGRHLGKDNKRSMHKTFRDVLHSVQHPWRGPRYSTALEELKGTEKEKYLGHRLAVRQGRQRILFVIDRWWKLHRWEAIKRIAGAGVLNHYRLNSNVRNALPQALMAPEKFSEEA